MFIKKQYKGREIKVKGVPFAIEETLPMRPSFEKFCERWPQILDYFEKPKPKKKVGEGQN